MKKLFTLLTLALTAVSGAWAADVISCSASLTATAGEPSVSNCSFAFYSDEGKIGTIPAGTSRGDYFYSKMNNDKNYYQVTLAQNSYTKFIAGDVIKVYLYTNSTTAAYKVGSETKTEVSATNQTKNKVFGYEHTLTANEIESDGTIRIYRSSSNTYFAKITVSGTRSTEAYTVTFNAGSNGSCGTESLTEESAGAGITLPTVTPNSGYTFNGWFDAETEGNHVGDAEDTYEPTANVTLYAQYSEESAPTISINEYSPSTTRGAAITFTATSNGSPTPTVSWYQSESATNTGGTLKGTGTTYSPDVTAEGTFYYYAVASNGIGSDATSNLITLTVTNPDISRTGFNSYYVTEGEVVVSGEKVICDDIIMEYGDASYNVASKDESTKVLNSNFVASVGTNTNGWGVTFTPSATGILSVGVVINNDKKFSITNVSTFESLDNSNSFNSIESDNWTPTSKFYGIVTIAVQAGQNYKFSVAGSKMSFYGFEFTTEVPVEIKSAGYATLYSISALAVPTGITAYVGEINGSSLKLTSVGETIPAKTAVVLEGEAGNHTFVATNAAAFDGENDLVGGTGAAATAGDLVLGVADDVVGFYSYTGTLATNKAYIPASKVASASGLRLVFEEEGEVTGIATLRAEENATSVFDLAGRRTNAKGLVIKNGKVVLVK